MKRARANTLISEPIDQWAVDLVADDGVFMNLSFAERVQAAHQMRAAGVLQDVMADRLRANLREVDRLLHRCAPRPERVRA